MELHRVALRRVGIALLVYLGLRTAGLFVDFVTGASHSFTIDVLSLILGILLLQGSLGAARWVAFITAFGLAMTIAGVVIGVPAAFFVAHGMWGHLMVAPHDVWGPFAIALDVLFAVWVLRQLRAPTVEEALAAAGRGSIRRAQRWGTGFGLGSIALIFAIMIPFMIMWPRITAPAVAAAHQQLGDDWQVQVTRYYTSSRAGWKAHVIARRGNEVKELDVGGDE
jgi:hypothetical protein